ncbi:hypothetical protein GALMADRAFT_283519 [Galerina marginata CBS 339.88]|uniref:CHAT domain-containing protein n=1 Tax=Galerina marginata (strain CBS 339.88) TaxID=685588 RepID=A0A067SLB8_GALM3|nr:hypothetical protein GALMADRAFT_283519 [Galerina marginata CBS 339.88]
MSSLPASNSGSASSINRGAGTSPSEIPSSSSKSASLLSVDSTVTISVLFADTFASQPLQSDPSSHHSHPGAPTSEDGGSDADSSSVHEGPSTRVDKGKGRALQSSDNQSVRSLPNTKTDNGKGVLSWAGGVRVQGRGAGDNELHCPPNTEESSSDPGPSAHLSRRNNASLDIAIEEASRKLKNQRTSQKKVLRAHQESRGDVGLLRREVEGFRREVEGLRDERRHEMEEFRRQLLDELRLQRDEELRLQREESQLTNSLLRREVEGLREERRHEVEGLRDEHRHEMDELRRQLLDELRLQREEIALIWFGSHRAPWLFFLTIAKAFGEVGAVARRRVLVPCSVIVIRHSTLNSENYRPGFSGQAFTLTVAFVVRSKDDVPADLLRITSATPQRRRVFTFRSKVMFRNINLNGFKYLVGKDASEFAPEDYEKETAFINVSASLASGDDNGGNIGLKFTIDDNRGQAFVSGNYLLAILFREILNTVSDHHTSTSGWTINSFQAVITFPRHFCQAQQEVITKVASLAGFARVGLLPDDLAAGLAYRSHFLPARTKGDVSKQDNALLVDVGHSAASITVISVTPENIAYRASESAPSLGGRDIDLAIAAQLSKDILSLHSYDINNDPQARLNLLNECSKAKEALIYSEEASFTLSLPITNFDYQALITWRSLQNIIAPLLGRLFVLMEQTLAKAGLHQNDIHTVVFMGTPILLYKSYIMDKLTGAVSRNIGYLSRAKNTLASCVKMTPSHLVGRVSTNPEFWIGRDFTNSSIKWDPRGEQDLGKIISGISEITISGEEGRRLLPSSNRNRPHDLSSFVQPVVPDTFSLKDMEDNIAEFEHRIDSSIAVLNETAEDDPKWPDRCNNLSALYLDKYQLTGNILTLNSGTVWAAKSLRGVNFRTGAKPQHLSNYAACLVKQYDNSGDLSLLDMAILYQSYIVNAVTAINPANAGYFINYGTFLQTRGEHIGDTTDIVEGAKFIQRAISEAIGEFQGSSSINLSDVPFLGPGLTNMGNALQVLYRWTGKLDDLHKAIWCHELALSFLNDKDAERSAALNRCGSVMMLHFQHFGDVENVKTAILYFTEALGYIPDHHPSKPLYLTGYTDALRELYNHSNDMEIIHDAIDTQKKVLLLINGNHPSRASYISKLGILYALKFNGTKNIEDLDEAILNDQLAVDLVKEDQHTQKYSFLSNLGSHLKRRFEESNSVLDLEKATSALEEALDHVSNGAGRAKVAHNLADAYYAHYGLKREEVYLLKCIERCKEVAVSSAPLTVRFHSAKVWTTATAAANDAQATLEATNAMVDLLSQLAWPGLSLSSQIEVLQGARQTACDAAAIALHYKDVARALEWLEQGRTVTWNQLLHMRSPLDDLKSQAPELAEKIITLSRQLETGGGVGYGEGSAPIYGLRVEKAGGTFSKNAIALERDKLLQEARAIPGFEKLMMAKEYPEFAVASYDGPVVVINVSQYRCDAVILSGRNHPFNLPLEEFSLAQAEQLKAMMIRALDGSARLQRSADPEGGEIGHEGERYGRPRLPRVTGESVDAMFRHILKELCDKVVSPILFALGIGINLDDDLPHVWWCPTGPLTFLPLHAAGIYAADDDRKTARFSALDYVVSSYIPSLGTLHNIMYRKHERPPFQMFSVIQPNTPGQSRLPATLLESSIIRKQGEKAGISGHMKNLQGEEATSKAVMAGIEASSWVHLACHGRQDVNEPTKSGLLLHDGTLFLDDIVQRPLPNADFAFLSACQTASGDHALPDEAIHLAAGMLLAGYNSVIASMWSIGDDDASTVADDVYGYLFNKEPDKGWEALYGTTRSPRFKAGKPDSRLAARALHRAVRSLRTKHTGRHGGTKFAAWVPYIHVGM